MANKQYVASSDVKVFPTSTRSTGIDEYSRRLVEGNLINLINRLTGVDAFIISGMDVSDTQVAAGEFDIHGYLFKTSAIDISTLTKTEGNTLSLRITTIYNSTTQLEELVTDGASSTLDSSSQFKGLAVLSSNTFPATGTISSQAVNYYYLKLASVSSGVWVPLRMDAGLNENPLLRQLIFRGHNVAVEVSNQNSRYGDNVQDLNTFLGHNLCINDGEV